LYIHSKKAQLLTYLPDYTLERCIA